MKEGESLAGKKSGLFMFSVRTQGKSEVLKRSPDHDVSKGNEAFKDRGGGGPTPPEESASQEGGKPMGDFYGAGGDQGGEKRPRGP